MRLMCFFVLLALVGCSKGVPPLADAGGSEPSSGITSQSERIHRLQNRLLKPHVTQLAQVDIRSAEQIAQAACTRSDGKWACSAPRPKVLATTAGTPIIPPSWTVSAWSIDPANSTGCASDANSGTQSTCGATGQGPLLTWHELNDHRWGCAGNPKICPRLRQSTTITFLSAQSNTSDPVYATWATEKGAVLQFSCNLGTAQQVITGTLASVTSKARGSNQLLQASLTGTGGGTVAAGQLIDIVHAAAHERCFVNTLVSGSTWTLSQCFVPATIPLSLGQAPTAETDNAANLDAFTIYQPMAINFVDVEPTVEEAASSFNQASYIYQCGTLSPTVAPTPMTIGTQVNIVESSIASPMWLTSASGVNYNPNTIHNTYMGQGIAGNIGIGNTTVIQITGGVIGNTTLYGMGGTLNTSLDGDVILSANFGQLPIGQQSFFGKLFVGTGTTLVANAGTVTAETAGYGAAQAWGAGKVGVWNGSRLAILNGTSAVAVFTLSGGLTINGQTTACSHSGANNPDVINCGISLTPANIDAAQSTTGFGGYAFIPGGGSICKNAVCGL